MTSVAIAIPNLNGEKYLYETLQSLQMQKIQPDEVILSDNFSTDRSLKIVEMFPGLNIRVIQPDRFLRMSENWNFVANQVRSDWFFLLSNDDLLRNTAVKRLKEIADGVAPSIGVISFKSEIINENSKLILGKYISGKGKLWKEYEFLEENIKYLHINAASVAIKKVSWIDIGGFPTEYSVLHDLVFYQRLILKWGILESKEVLGRYRIYSNKPNSEARSLLVVEDLQTYESSDLKRYAEKYPELLQRYTFEESKSPASPLSRIYWIRKLHTFVLSIMTFCRRGQSVLGYSGFPGRF